jgi:mono/diheme cytochrome c family protein
VIMALVSDRYWQMLDGLEARPLAPFDLAFINRQLQLRPAPEQSLQRAYALKARQLMAEAKMNPSTESEMPVRLRSQDLDFGQAEFLSKCAACRGADGKGAGPLSATIKPKLPDLTILAKRNHGVCSRYYLQEN